MTMNNCNVTGNIADSGGGGMNIDFGPVTVEDCLINENVSHGHGGGLRLADVDKSQFVQCSLDDNNASGSGGGVYCWKSSPEITACTISENVTVGAGGGICCFTESNPTINQCNILSNTANNGGGIGNINSNPNITDCMITDNTANNPDGGGGLFSTGSSDPSIAISLLCSNDPVQIVGNWADEGGNTICCPGDATGDYVIDVDDVLYVLSAWDTDDPDADFDDNGVVNVDDILILLGHFGESCA